MVPGPPPHLRSVDEVDDMWDVWTDHVVEIRCLARVSEDNPGEATEEYMMWFVQVSHPWATPASYAAHAQQYLPAVLTSHEEPLPPYQEDMLDIM